MSKPEVDLSDYMKKRALPGRELFLYGEHGRYLYIHKPGNQYGAVLRGTDWIAWFDLNEIPFTLHGYCLENLKAWEWERLRKEAEELFIRWGTLENFLMLPLMLCISKHNYF